jgi:membrane associated rhomboid family serine protease
MSSLSLIRAIIKLSFFLVILPFLITHLHLSHVAYQSNFIFVGPLIHARRWTGTKTSTVFMNQMNVDAFYGIWQGFVGPDNQMFFKMVRSSWTYPLPWGWPSVTQVTALLKDSFSQDNSMAVQPLLRYNRVDNRWCLSNGDLIVCSKENDVTDSLSPPSGIWARHGRAQLSIRLSHYGPTERQRHSTTPQNMDGATTESFRRNPNRKTRRNQNIEQITQRPATTLLMAINIGLAYLYWNRRTNPSDVSKIYIKIVKEHELWRSFTGATAHFEALHLGFNMMSLYSLGTALEENFGSIPFLFYNISLIPITTIMMMCVIYLQIKLTGDVSLVETSTVGYSGVLFAWMVVASLEQPQNCPIPFFESVCFPTYDVIGFKWNISPMIQLVVAQCIMPRVSFVGHFAGIVAGFLLHWHVLPLQVVQPTVLFPSLFLLHLWWARGFIPIHVTTENTELLQLDLEQVEPRFHARKHRNERDQSMHVLLSRMGMVLFFCVAAASASMDITMTTALALQAIIFYFCKQAHLQLIATSTNTTEYTMETQRIGILWKVYIIVTCMTIVTESMTLASWVITSDFFYGTHFTFSFLQITIILCFIIFVQTICLSLACKSLNGIGQSGSGVFCHMFKLTVLESAVVIGTRMITFRSNQAYWTTHEDHGVGLGTAPTIPIIECQQASEVL